MKKTVLCIAAVLALLFCLSGCYPLEPQYEEAEAELVKEKGAELMEEWLSENLPDARLDKCTAYIAFSPVDGNKYLTDYVQGTYLRNGLSTWFNLNTVSGEVYFPAEPALMGELSLIAEEFLYETMGVSPENPVSGFKCAVVAPVAVSPESRTVPGVGVLELGLPQGAEDLDTFVRNADVRHRLYVDRVLIITSGQEDVSGWDLGAFDRLEEACGMELGYLRLESGAGSVTFEDRDGICTVRRDRNGTLLSGEGYYLTGAVESRVEVRSGAEVTMTHTVFDAERDLVFEKTPGGFRFELPGEDIPGGFCLWAEGDSELVSKRPVVVTGEGVEIKALWEKQDSGERLLVNRKTGEAVLFDFSGELRLS